MSLGHNTSVIRDGLVFYCDAQNKKSWVGAPCTNIIAGTNLGVYNNPGANITHSLTQTTDTYQGQPIWRHVITPQNATGVSQWASNAGVGVYHGLGTSLWANTYTANSIFFRSDSAFAASPIWTHYSNIAGWQSTANYDVLSDGWYRGKVIWYDTVNRSDSKYWAINTANPTIGVPVTIYWAAPFRADANYSAQVPTYTNSTRSNTQALVDLVGGNTLTATSLTYNADGSFSFNGSSNYISSSLSWTAGQALTVCGWVYSTESTATYRCFFDTVSARPMIWWNTLGKIEFDAADYTSASVYRNQWTFVAISKPSGSAAPSYYINGALVGTGSSYTVSAATPTWFNRAAGQTWLGSAQIISVYNRALSAAEIMNNYNAARGRYNLL